MIFRRLVVLVVATLTLGTVIAVPVQPAAAVEPNVPVPVNQLMAAVDDLLQNMNGELAATLESAGNVPLAGEDLDMALAPVTEALTDARTFLATWLIPTVNHGTEGGSTRAEQFIEGSLWVLLGPDDALDHPDLDATVRQALEDAEVPGLGLDLLRSADNGPAGPDDVVFIADIDTETGIASAEVKLTIGQQTDLIVPAQFDLGLSVNDIEFESADPADASAAPDFIPDFGVDLSLSRGLAVDLGWSATLHAGVELPIAPGSAAIGPFLGPDTGLSASAELSIARNPGDSSGFTGRVALGVLQAEFSDGVIREESGDLERSSLTATATAGLAGSDRVAIANLGPDALAVGLSLEGAVRLQVNAGAGHLTDAVNSAIDSGQFAVGLPSLNFSLIADPTLSVSAQRSGNGKRVTSGVPEVRLENLEIDTREFVRAVVVPMATAMAQIMEPINEALGLDQANTVASEGLLNEPLPVVSDLSDDPVTLRSIGLDEEFEGVVDVLTAITDFPAQAEAYVNSPAFERDLGENGQLPLPCLTIVLDGKSPLFVGKVRTAVPCLVKDGIQALEDFDPKISVDISVQPSVFNFDLMSTESFYNLLLGNPVDIISIGLPELDATVSAEPSLDLKVVELEAQAEAHAEVGLRFVYDSTGIETMLDQILAGQPVDAAVLADGFYIKTRSGACATAAELAKDFEDRERGCEIGLGAGVGGRIQLGPDVANVWGEVRAKGDIGFSVTDPNDDEQLRGHELAALTENWAKPENLFCLFDLRGAGSAYVAAGSVNPIKDVRTSFPGVSGDFSLLDLLSAEFDICSGVDAPVIAPIEPVLAHTTTSTTDRTLVVHTGPFAALRRMADRKDDQPIEVQVTVQDMQVRVFVKTKITGADGALVDWQAEQFFDGPFDKVVVPGGLGDDLIQVSVPATATVDAGPGDDVVVVDQGPAIVDGGNGVDDITTAEGDDMIDAGPDGGIVRSNGGDDIVNGGNGPDELRTGDGDDLVYGKAANDIIDTGDGSDMVDAGSGDDTVSLGSGDDSADAGPGDDTVNGGSDDDNIETGIGNDTVRAGLGRDTVDTGPGNDRVSGDGDGNSAITCAAGGPFNGDRDNIRTGSGDDIIHTGGGNDAVDTGTGDDCVISVAGADDVFFGSLADVFFGDTFIMVSPTDLTDLLGQADSYAVGRQSTAGRTEVRGISRIQLSGAVTPTVSGLVDPLTVVANDLSGLAVSELGEDLTVEGSVSLDVRPMLASNGPIEFGYDLFGRVEITGLGVGTIDAEPDSPLSFTGRSGPDELIINGGLPVNARLNTGADQVTMAPLSGLPVQATVDGGGDIDTVIIDYAGQEPTGVGPFRTDRSQFQDLEMAKIRRPSASRLGWDDGVLTVGPEATPLVHLGTATTVDLPADLGVVDVDASDVIGSDPEAGGRSVQLIGTSVTVGGARSVPTYEPLPSGDQILVLRGNGDLEIFEATADARRLSRVPGPLEGIGTVPAYATAADIIDADGVDEIFIPNGDGAIFYNYQLDGTGPVLDSRGSLGLPSRTLRDSSGVVGDNGLDSVITLATNNSTCHIHVFAEAFRDPSTFDCPNSMLTSGLPLEQWEIEPSGYLGADFAAHHPAGELLLLNLPSGGGRVLQEEDFTSRTLLAGPVTAIECPHGHRFASERDNVLRRIKEDEDAIGILIDRISSFIDVTRAVDLIDIEPIDDTNVLATLSNGEVHLDLDYCRFGAVFGETTDTGIRVGPTDVVFAGRVLTQANMPAGLPTPATAAVDPVTINAPGALAFELSTGERVDTVTVGQTSSDVMVDSGAAGDLVTLDFDAGPSQRLITETGSGNDQVGLRVTGDPKSLVVDTGPDADRVDLFDGLSNPFMSIEGAGDDDLLRIHPEGRNVTFIGPNPNVPVLPNGSAAIEGQASFDYRSFETVLVNAGPMADLDAPGTVAEGSLLRLSAGDSRSPDGLDLFYSWDLDGDGTFDDGLFGGDPITTNTVELLPLDDGVMRVAVRVTDELGRFADASAEVQVTVAPPSVAVAGGSEQTYVGFASFLAVIETGNPGDDTTASVLIDWGDGTAFESAALDTVAHVYQQPGIYTARVLSVTDEDGTFPVALQTHTIAVTPIELATDGATSDVEGSPYQLSLQTIDAPTVTRWEVDWGDGQQESTPGSASGADVDLIHLYDGNSVNPIAVSAFFEAGLAGQDEVEVAVDAPVVTVANQPPTFLGFVPDSAPEGLVSVFISSEDPGDDRIETWAINWGDGTVTTVPGSDTPFDPFEVTHQYLPGSYEVTVTANDDDGAHQVYEQQLEVSNTLPEIRSIIAGDGTGNGLLEGGAVPIQVNVADSDPAGLRYEFTSPTAELKTVNGLAPKASFVFNDDGTHQVTVTVSDEFGGSVSETVDVDTTNSAPRASLRFAGVGGRILEGSDAEIEVRVIDRGDDRATTATIDWGDGSDAEVVPLDEDGRGTARHRYPDGSANIVRPELVDGKLLLDGLEVTDANAFVVAGTPVTIKLLDVTDEDGTHPADDTVETEVIDVSPTAELSVETSKVNDGGPDADGPDRHVLTVANITDPGQDTITSHSIDWGNGVIERFEGAPAPGAVFTHPTGPDVGPVQLLVVDEDGTHIAGIVAVADFVEPIDPPNPTGTTKIVVRARGHIGVEEMLVEAGGVSRKFTVGTEFADYELPLGAVAADGLNLVRVSFTNDFYRPGVIDRNLVVDKITVAEVGADGIERSTDYETEDPSVFSTGTWSSLLGCAGRFAAAELLACNGHFIYRTQGQPDPVVIEVVAKGDTGEELMTVTGGTEVRTFAVTKDYETYRMEVPWRADLDEVVVAFINDFYRRGIKDRNLNVDRIMVDGVAYETEDPAVYSTGTWGFGSGCSPKHAKSQRLQCEGGFTIPIETPAEEFSDRDSAED